MRGQRLRPRTHPEDSPQQVVEQGNDRQADEERDSDSGVQESDVRTASARQQQYGGTSVETDHVELPGTAGQTRSVRVATAPCDTRGLAPQLAGIETERT